MNYLPDHKQIYCVFDETTGIQLKKKKTLSVYKMTLDQNKLQVKQSNSNRIRKPIKYLNF